jgi:signal transduction histidine kinase/CheY-like chemotaxis protein
VGIKAKILILVGLMIILTVASMTYIISNNARDVSRDMAYQVAEQVAQRYGEQVKGILEKSMEDARVLNIVFQQLKKAGSKREILDDILLQTTLHTEDTFGAWMLWQRNAFDNMDKAYIHTLGHGPTGRVNSYWHWEGDDVVNEVNIDWQTSGWYQNPKKYGRETLEDPYIYKVSGRSMLLISAIEPIMIDGVFHGVVGIDVKLNALQELVKDLRVLDTGYSTLIANNGMYVTHPNEELIGTIMNKGSEQLPLFHAIESGMRYEVESTHDLYLDEPAYKISVPILIGKTKKSWSLVVSIPNSTIRHASESLKHSTLVIGSFAGLLMLVLLTLLVRHILSPIIRITNNLSELVGSTNKYIPQLDVGSNDEVGRLAASFNILANDLNKSHHELADVNENILKLNNDLERRVNERTQELSSSNKELLLAIKAAEAANDAKSRFLANMSHELRTPLNAILGLSELMCMDSNVSHEHSDKLHIINQSGEHLLAMINDVLDLSKIESGTVEIREEEVDLEHLLNNIYRMMTIQASSKKITLDSDFTFNKNTLFLGDEGKLRQVLINLISNAIKFTVEGGVKVSCYFEKTNLYKESVLIFEVEDTGVGINDDDAKIIFKPFIQLENVIQGGAGTGLGLAISKNYVESMGGELEFSSHVGRGSIFKIRLPVKLSDSKRYQEKELSGGDANSIVKGQRDFRILIVEDSAQNRLLLSAILRRVGVQYKEAVNGQEAVELFNEWQPDLIWMDMRMPVKDGYQGTKEIRQLPNGKQVKIIAITASAFKEEHPQILSAGCDDLLLKPYKPQQIYSVMSKELGMKFEYSKRKLQANDLSVLPLSQIELLHEKVLNLNPDEIALVIDTIALEHGTLAQQLYAILESLNFNDLLEILEKITTRTGGK